MIPELHCNAHLTFHSSNHKRGKLLSCSRRGDQVADAAKRNGVVGQTSRFLNTLGNWNSYRDLSSFEEVPERIAQITESFFGLKGLLRGSPKLAGVMGAIMAVHALEQATGAAGTMGMRALGRGQPFGKYRGLILRRSPLAAKAGQLFNRLSGGRVQQADGFYFFESGRTWLSNSVETQLGDTPRTLTYLRSLSIPNREFFFDRRIEPQQQVDIALGDSDPETIPGYLGSTNELENITNLGNFKRLFYAANWLLVDPSERDGGGPELVDYDALTRGSKPGDGAAGYYTVSGSPSGGGPGYSSGRSWPSSSSSYGGLSRPIPPPPPSPPGYGSYVPVRSTGSAITVPISNSLKPAAPPDPGQVTDRVNIEGQDRPVVIKRIVTSPLTQRRRADALFYDEDIKQWREVVDDDIRERLAKAVDEGLIKM
jgi:hypothetical protein